MAVVPIPPPPLCYSCYHYIFTWRTSSRSPRQVPISMCLCCDTWRVIVINCTHLGCRSGQVKRRCLGQTTIIPIRRTADEERMILSSWRAPHIMAFHFSAFITLQWVIGAQKIGWSVIIIIPYFPQFHRESEHSISSELGNRRLENDCSEQIINAPTS